MPKANICNKCNSKNYCKNRAYGMMACKNFNKFPKEEPDAEKANYH